LVRPNNYRAHVSTEKYVNKKENRSELTTKTYLEPSKLQARQRFFSRIKTAAVSVGLGTIANLIFFRLHPENDRSDFNEYLGNIRSNENFLMASGLLQTFPYAAINSLQSISDTQYKSTTLHLDAKSPKKIAVDPHAIPGIKTNNSQEAEAKRRLNRLSKVNQQVKNNISNNSKYINSQDVTSTQCIYDSVERLKPFDKDAYEQFWADCDDDNQSQIPAWIKTSSDYTYSAYNWKKDCE
jgi:hypothetical protein